MKSATTSTISGCIVWFIVFGVISMCIIPVASAIGGLSSTSDLALRTVGPIVCPKETTPEVYSYSTTTTDEYGGTSPATAYEIHCMSGNGENVRTDPVGYAFLWIGVLVLIGFVLTGILAFLFAAPAGILIGKLFNRNKTGNQISNIEPR